MEQTHEGIGLADAIEAVRIELRRAQELGRASPSDVRFVVGTTDVEFAVSLTKKAGGGASLTVLGVLGLSGQGERSWGETHRVRVSLTPLASSDGEPFEVAAISPGRPDRMEGE